MKTLLPSLLLAPLALALAFPACSLLNSSRSPQPSPAPKPVATAAIRPASKPASKVASSKSLRTMRGKASWYSVKSNGGTHTASGERLSNSAMTAAHKTLPLGSKVRVTNLRNGKSAVVRITDRGPYVKGRIIDVTVGVAKKLGFYSRGITPCKVEVLSYGKKRKGRR